MKSRERELLVLLEMVCDAELMKLSSLASERDRLSAELDHWSQVRTDNSLPVPGGVSETSVARLANDALWRDWTNLKRVEINQELALAEARVELQKKLTGRALGRFESFRKTVGCPVRNN